MRSFFKHFRAFSRQRGATSRLLGLILISMGPDLAIIAGPTHRLRLVAEAGIIAAIIAGFIMDL
jgi:hypothetical protein